jgi:acetyltransferase-like isoleucine patch superfamily enzyme
VTKPLHSRIVNRLLAQVARFVPGSTTLRPMLHRLRGVKIGRNVFIGDDVYLDNEYPEAIEIGDDVQISIRAVIIAHTRGAGRVIVGNAAFIGPQVVVACSAGRMLRIGEGAVLSAGCVVTKSVPPRVVLTPAPAQVAAHAMVALSVAETMEQFQSGLRPPKAAPRASGDG